MQYVTFTWTEDSMPLYVFSNGVMVRRVKDDSSTMIVSGGVAHTVTEPISDVVELLASFPAGCSCA